MKTLLHKPIVFIILLLLTGIFFTGPTAMGQTSCPTLTEAILTIVSSRGNDKICPGTSVTFTATASDLAGGTVSSYNWYLNGVLLEGDDAHMNTYTTNTLQNGDQIFGAITIDGGVCLRNQIAWSNIITVEYGYSTPSVSIESSDADNFVCAGTSVTFTANAVNTGGGTVHYEWFFNYSKVGSDQKTYTTNIAGPGLIECYILITGGSCLTATTANSSGPYTSAFDVKTPAVAISTSDGDDMLCANEVETFTAIVSNYNDGEVSYQWKVNNISVGTNDRKYVPSSLNDGDAVSCEITITNGRCITSNTAVSNVINMKVYPYVSPKVQITSDDADNAICVGSQITFTADVTYDGPGTINYHWTVDNQAVGGNQPTFTSTNLPKWALVRCLVEITGWACLDDNTILSNEIEVNVQSNTPVVSISSSSANNTIYAGASVTFTAHYGYIGGGTLIYNWKVDGNSAGSNSQTFTTTAIEQGDQVTCEIEVVGGQCMAATTAVSEPIVMTVLSGPPDAGTLSGVQEVCFEDYTQFSSTVPGGIWSSGDESVALIDPVTGYITARSAGTATITYTVLTATSTRTVTVVPRPWAGEDGIMNICSNNVLTEADLFNALGDNPQEGGTWEWPVLPSSMGAGFGIRSVGLVAGVYTYTVAGVSPCGGSDKSTVTVSILPAPNAGLDGTLTICAGATPTPEQLFGALGGSPDAGGEWTGPVENVYTYTVTADPSCNVKTEAKVTIIQQAAPNAGSDGSLTICRGWMPSEGEMFHALGGTPDPGGEWWFVDDLHYKYVVRASSPCSEDAFAIVTLVIQAPPNAGTDGVIALCEGTVPSDEELFSKLGGSPDLGGTWELVEGSYYRYTVNATAPCLFGDEARVTVHWVKAPDAGENGTLEVCAGSIPSPEDLFGALGGTPDPGGTWSDPVNGVYTYIVQTAAPCRIALATVTVTEKKAPFAGYDGRLLVCGHGNVPESILFGALGGGPDLGGTWSGPTIPTSLTGVVELGPVPANTVLYTYTVTGTEPCMGTDVATVTVFITEEPDAGISGTLFVCAGTTPSTTMLFGALGGTPDLGGVWSPAVNGVYTYTVSAAYPCTGTSVATVTVTERAAPNAGISGSLVLCAGTIPTTEMLFRALGGTPDPGGVWSDPVNGVYTYTVSAVYPCTIAAVATVTVTEQAQPNAGERGTLIVCQGTIPSPAQLFDALEGTPDVGGTWSGPVSGVYTYRVNATSPCVIPDEAIVVVRELRPPNAGSNGTLSVCQGMVPTPEQLFDALEGTPDPGGSWSGPVSGVYTYKVTGMSPCPDATARVTVTQIPLPTQPGTISGPAIVCQGTEQIYSVPAVAGLTYEWTLTGTGWSIKNGQGSASITVIVGSTNTVLSVVASNANGCKSTARTRSVSYRPIPVITSGWIDGVPGFETSITYGCASPILKVVDQSGALLYSYQWFKSNSDGSNGIPVSLPVINLLKGNQYRVPPANGYYDEDYGDQKGIGAGTHYYYAIVTTTTGCSSKSPVFKVVVNPAKALGDYDAKSYYTGPKFVWTTTTTSNTATATLSAFLRNSEEGNCGDIATARVTFEYRTSSGDWMRVPNGTNLPVSYVDPRDPSKGGTAAVIAQLSIPQNQNSENYDIRVLIGGNYYNAPPSDAVSICQVIVGKVVPGGSIAGGAHLPNLSSTGYVQGTSIPPSYLCFGVEYVQKGKSVTSPKGRVTLRIFSKYDRTGRPTSVLHTYIVRSNAIAGLSITGNKATFTAKSNIAEEIPDLAYPGGIRVEAIEGNCVMTMTVEDWCSTLLSNVLDKVGITIQRNAGGIWYSNNWIKSKTEPACIIGGDILVVAPSTLPVKSGTSDMNSKDATASFAEFNVKVFGNPSSSMFNVAISGTNDKVAMRVVDISGRLLETRIFAGNSNIQFGSDFRPGTYFAEFIQGDNRKTVTLIKSIR